MMHGFLNIDKPSGITSHDVVARIRRLSGQRRVGHAGTLDPAATGVLVVALGGATRLIEYVQRQTLKRYLATVHLGVTTTTDDADGEIVAQRPTPPLDAATIEQALAPLRGTIWQTPPMYAALHHQGRRLYELARAGVMVDMPPRQVEVERLELVRYDPPLAILDVVCGSGTYIRALARDLGVALGCGAHLAALRRTAVGAFRIEDAVPLRALEEETQPDVRAVLRRRLMPPEVAVADWHVLHLDEERARRIRRGLPIPAPPDAAAQARAHAPDGALLALLRYDGSHWRPIKVFDWTDA
ncbi:tRNA pseudouridine(55) synthase TruB [Roseiflexus sp.]|uniref:tRNA pseudouridine(55) synthase TruB n=1 Tax=Roseiflexus sp. TaxID=2562120 RepID=UPI00398B7FEA